MIPEKHHELHRRKDPKNDKKPHLLLILEFFKDEVNRDSLQGRVSVLEEMEISILLSLTRNLYSEIAPLISLYIENVEANCFQSVKKQKWGQIFKNMKVLSPSVKIRQILCALWQRQSGQKSLCPAMASTLQGFKHKTC